MKNDTRKALNEMDRNDSMLELADDELEQVSGGKASSYCDPNVQFGPPGCGHATPRRHR